MQMLAIQPLDLLPPCSVTFRDYALAVLRSEQVANPTDPSGYRELMVDCFVKRGILQEKDRKGLMEPAQVFRRPALDVFHPVDAIAASRGGAYRFLDDNRAKLFIPLNAEIIVTEVVRANKLTREGRSLPEQIIVQYIWREDVLLDGGRFGRFAGERTTMLCGATMVLDQNGNLIHWARKPGSTEVGTSKAAAAEQAEGTKRLKELLDTIAARVAAGTIGETIGGELGLLERASPPFGFQMIDGAVRFQLAPHFCIRGDAANERHGRTAMADKLLVRLFDVGLGDCIYCRIPKAHKSGRDFHILIDCGTLSSTAYLSAAVEKLKTMLPSIGRQAARRSVGRHARTQGSHGRVRHEALGRGVLRRDLDDRGDGSQASGSREGQEAARVRR